jgi:glycosyltransferase involved in cell wall biosynthesis
VSTDSDYLSLDPADAPPRVTVVIPCYKYGHFLAAATAAALDQPGVDVDVLIVDDASPDGSREVAVNLAAADDRISVIAHEVNRGHIATYNEGLAAATGEFVTLVSADDLLAPGALTRATALFRRFPAVGMVYGAVVRFGGDSPPPPHIDTPRYRLWRGAAWAELAFGAGRNPLFSPEAVLRTDVQRKIGDYRVEEPHAGDFAMWLRVAAVADIAFVGGVDHAYYRDHGANMHTTTFAVDQASGMITDLRHRWEVLERASVLFDDGERLLDIACATLAIEALNLASRAYLWGLTSTWPVRDLEAFALDVYPAAQSLREYRALRRRKRVGRLLANHNPVFLPRERRLSAIYAADTRNRRWLGI